MLGGSDVCYFDESISDFQSRFLLTGIQHELTFPVCEMRLFQTGFQKRADLFQRGAQVDELHAPTGDGEVASLDQAIAQADRLEQWMLRR